MVHREITNAHLEDFNDFLKKNVTPPYFKLFAFQKNLKNVSPFARSLLAGPFLYLVFYVVAFLAVDEIPLNALFSMAVLSGWVSAFLVLNTNSYQKSLEAIGYISTMLTTDAQLNQLRNDLHGILINPNQTWFSLIVATLITLLLVLIGLDLPTAISVIIYCFAFLTIFAGGYMLWMSGSALVWSVKFSNNGPYSLNHIPSKTIGIRRLSRLIGTFALSFSLAVCLGLLFFYTAPWVDEQIFDYVNTYLAYPFVLFAVAFIIIPQLSVRKIIVDEKERLLVYLENKLAEHNILESDFSNEKYERYKNAQDLHSKIFATPDYALDFGTIGKFVSSLAFPLILTLIQQPKIFEKVTTYFGF